MPHDAQVHMNEEMQYHSTHTHAMPQRPSSEGIHSRKNEMYHPPAMETIMAPEH